MRFLLVLCSALALLTSPLFGAHVQFLLTDFVTSPALAFMTNSAGTNANFYIAPLSTPMVNGTTIVDSDTRVYTTDSSGSIIVSNMVGPATYKCTLRGRFTQTQFQITIPNTSSLINAKDYLSVSTNSPNAVNAYSMAAADARFLTVTNNYTAAQVDALLTNRPYALWRNVFQGPAISSILEASMLPGGPGIGTTNIGANFWTLGKTLRIHAAGVLSSSGSPNKVTLQFKTHNTQMAFCQALPAANLASAQWTLIAWITCNSTGVGNGYVSCGGFFALDTTANNDGTVRLYTITPQTTAGPFDTTLASTVDLTATWANTGQTIVMNATEIEVIP